MWGSRFMRILLQTAAQNRANVRRRHPAGSASSRPRLQDRRDRVASTVSPPSNACLAAQHFVQHAPERPDVCSPIDRLAARLLGAHARAVPRIIPAYVAWTLSVGDTVRPCGPLPPDDGALGKLGEAEVEDFDFALWRDLDVGWLQIAVDDAAIVRRFERVDELPVQSRGRRRSVSSEPAFIAPMEPSSPERFSLDELHDDRRRMVGILDPVDRGDVGMIQRREQFRLALKARDAIGIAADGLGQDLDRDVALQLVSRARYTSPMPPAPIASRISNAPNRVPGREAHRPADDSNAESACRPVKTIARPCSSAAAITSASRTDPPGCTTAVAPAGRDGIESVAEREERVGRRDRSAAATDARRDAAFTTATLTASTRLICPAPIASVRRRIGEDDGVRLHVRADRARRSAALPTPPRSAARFVTTLNAFGQRPGVHGLRASTTRSRSCIEHRRRESIAVRRLRRAERRKSAVTTRMLRLAARARRGASSSTAGAITASMNVDTIASAVATSIARLSADDAAERGEAVRRRARARRHRPPSSPSRRAARVGVLDHRRRRLVELEDDARRGVEVEQVRVRQLLALQDCRLAPKPSRRPASPAYHAAC